MGIKGFYEAFVDENTSKIVGFKHFSGTKIAIDMSVMIMSAVNTKLMLKGPDGLVTNHINTVLNNIMKMYEHGILPICVLDPKKHIVSKSDVQKKRFEDSKEKNDVKIKDFKEQESNYKNEVEIINKMELSDVDKKEFITSLDEKYRQIAESKKMYDNYIKGEISLYQIARADTIHILESLNVPYIIAPDGVEAEQLCALLCKIDAVQYVWTKDMDALVFGAPRIFFGLKNKPGKFIIVERKQILDEKKITEQQLIRMSVALGCDFADKIKGIGPNTVFKKHDSLVFNKEQQAAIDYFENKNIDEKVKAVIREKWTVLKDIPKRNTNELDKLIIWLRDLKGFNKIIPKVEKVFRKSG